MNDIEVKAIEFIKFYKEHCLKQEQENMKNGNYEIVKDEQFVYKNLEIVLKLIENLLKKRQSDKERINEQLIEIISYQEILLNAYIPKSLIKEKIEELETKMEYENNEKVLIWLHKQRAVLEELLEKR